MITHYDASQWVWHETSATEGEKRSCTMDVQGVSSLELEVRSAADVVVNLITLDGLTLPVQEGKFISVHAKLSGFAGVEIVASTPFCYRTSGLTLHEEKVDPRSMTVIAEESSSAPMSQMIADEIRKHLQRQEAQRTLTEDEAMELVDDYLQGDLEFEDEPDMFGLGYEERYEEWEKRKAEFEAAQAAPEDDGEDEVPPAEQPPTAVKTAVPAKAAKQGSLPIAAEKQ